MCRATITIPVPAAANSTTMDSGRPGEANPSVNIEEPDCSRAPPKDSRPSGHRMRAYPTRTAAIQISSRRSTDVGAASASMWSLSA